MDLAVRSEDGEVERPLPGDLMGESRSLQEMLIDLSADDRGQGEQRAGSGHWLGGGDGGR